MVGRGGASAMPWVPSDRVTMMMTLSMSLISPRAHLMGCSSGRLESVNRRDTKLLDCLLPMYYEPEGVAQSYIAAGAPCVVGNLWDVTDRDIDKLAMSMLERYFDSTSDASLPECLAQARSACKLRYMIGCAPVCYGIPVFKRR